MLRDAKIWVLITDGRTARIGSSQDGLSSPILVPQLRPAGWDDYDEDKAERAYRAWFRSPGRETLAQSEERQFALHLAQLVHEGARDRAFDGLIIVASAAMAARLEHALSRETRALLIGRIVQDVPSLDSFAENFASELRH